MIKPAKFRHFPESHRLDLKMNGHGEASKGFEVQQQVRQNAEELNDFLRGFSSWQKEMKSKDQQLLEASSKRRSDDQTEAIKTPRRKLSSPPPPNVLSPLKREEKKVKSIDKQQAAAEKDRGNEHFKSGKYDLAIECYSKGIQCDPTNAILPANRAMALLKKGQNKDAEVDCTLAISLDPTYVKAYQRRATARSSMKRFEEAIGDYRKVLGLEPSNKQAQIEIGKLEKAMKDVKPVEKRTEALGDIKENLKSNLFREKPKIPGQVFPIDKKPHLRSQKPLKRIEISEVGGNEIIVTEKQDFIIKEAKSQVKTENKPAKRIQIEEISSSDVSTDDKLTTDEDNSPPKPSKSTGFVKEVEETIMKKPSVPDSSSTKKKPTKKVMSSMSFYSQWRSLSSVDERFKFLNLHLKSTKSYTTIFNHSMESEVFEGIIDVLHANRSNDDVHWHLAGLSMVPRISAIVMFMDNKSKLNDLVKNANAQNLTDAEVKSIQKCFK